MYIVPELGLSEVLTYYFISFNVVDFHIIYTADQGLMFTRGAPILFHLKVIFLVGFVPPNHGTGKEGAGAC